MVPTKQVGKIWFLFFVWVCYVIDIFGLFQLISQMDISLVLEANPFLFNKDPVTWQVKGSQWLLAAYCLSQVNNRHLGPSPVFQIGSPNMTSRGNFEILCLVYIHLGIPQIVLKAMVMNMGNFSKYILKANSFPTKLNWLNIWGHMPDSLWSNARIHP